MTTLRGTVNDRRQPIVTITVRGQEGRERTVEALLNTGFNGTLSLPPSVVADLHLPFWFSRTVTLADGSQRDVANHRGRILWDGVERPTRIVASGDQAIIGMALLLGYLIRIEAIDGGAVIVEPV